MDKFRTALGQLKSLILPDETPAVAAVPPSHDTTDMVASRARLAGAVARASDGSWFAFPTGPDRLGPSSKKITISSDGVLAEAKDMTESAIAALGLEQVILNVLTDPTTVGSSAAVVWRAGGLEATIKPIADASGLKKVSVA